jgi:hypothetical protein
MLICKKIQHFYHAPAEKALFSQYFFLPAFAKKLDLQPADVCLDWWSKSSRLFELYFTWLPNHLPFTRQCDLSELEDAYGQFKSFVSLTNSRLPGVDGFDVSDVNIFFIDTRVRGLIR